MKQLLLVLLFFTQLLIAQKNADPDKMYRFNIVVNQDEQIVKTQILKDPKNVKIDNEATYVWYTTNQLIETKGGYDGKLLHGYYKAFFFSNQLKESGEIRYGLKSNKWCYWYSNGNLREIITWKKGRKNGAYSIYNDQGKLMAKGNFKNDLLNGRFYTYDNYGRVTDKKRYKKGEEIVKAPKIKKEKQPKQLNEKKENSGADLDKSDKENNKKSRAGKTKKKRVKKKEIDPENQDQTRPQSDSTRKENFFQRVFKKKKKEPKAEPVPASITA